MTGLNKDQYHSLLEIAESLQAADYGQRWPQEYNCFFCLWGYFNSIYDKLYTDDKEWKRIARFALDEQFSISVWNALNMDTVQELTRQPCVGNGRDEYKPVDHVRIAFHTLRTEFQVDVQEVCQNEKCKRRRELGWQLCSERDWPDLPRTIQEPEHAKRTPLGATLTILYQIRNNLFHGSKLEMHDPQRERNRLLVDLSAQIMDQLLREVVRFTEQLPLVEAR